MNGRNMAVNLLNNCHSISKPGGAVHAYSRPAFFVACSSAGPRAAHSVLRHPPHFFAARSFARLRAVHARRAVNSGAQELWVRFAPRVCKQEPYAATWEGHSSNTEENSEEKVVKGFDIV